MMYPTDVAPIDVEVALERLDGDREFLDEMVEEFINLVPEQIAELHRATQEDRAKEVERIGHSIKGAAASLSIEPTRALGLQLEEIGREGCLDAAEDLIAQLENELNRLRDFAATLE